MKTLLVRYRTKPGRGDENQELIEAVFDELSATAPGGLRYASFRAADGVTFVHLAKVEENGGNPLTETAAFKRFQAELKDRCEEQPSFTELTEIGSYELLAG